MNRGQHAASQNTVQPCQKKCGARAARSRTEGLHLCVNCALRLALAAGAHRRREQWARERCARLAVGGDVEGVARLVELAHGVTRPAPLPFADSLRPAPQAMRATG